MRSKIFSTLLCLLLAFCTLMPSVCFADYGSTIPSAVQGTRGDIITVKRPESLSASTSDKTYTISATGAQGTRIKIYKQRGDVGYIVSAERKIGASGLYSTVVDLTDDNNVFIIYAENASGSQVVRVEISKVRKSTVDRLKGVTVTIKNFFS